MQLSSTRVFVLVEGRERDTFFYSELCRPICEAATLEYEIIRADWISGGGGKQTLIGLYDYLQSNGSLKGRPNGRGSFCIFYLDKDTDDILGNLIHSPHVVYTPFYTVENALFIYGELVRAAAAASSLDAATIRLRIPNSNIWRRDKAEQWKEFVTFCLFSQKHKVNCDCTYGRNTSPLNDPPDAPTNMQEVIARKVELQRLLAFPTKKFDRKFGAAVRLVGRIYRKGQHDVVFNGKWYRTLLIREIELAARGQHYNRLALANGLTASLSATLDFDAPWADQFKVPLRNLINEEAGSA